MTTFLDAGCCKAQALIGSEKKCLDKMQAVTGSVEERIMEDSALEPLNSKRKPQCTAFGSLNTGYQI